MDLILSYYRNPIFGILVLISLVLIIALAQIIFASLKENQTNKNIKKYLANFNAIEPKYLSSLSFDERLNLANGFFKASMFLECKYVLINLLNEFANDKDLLYLLSVCDLRLGLLNDAKQNLLKILKSRARDELALLCLGYIHFKLNEINECKEVYKCLCVLGDYEKDLEFINNYKSLNTKSFKEIKIDDETINPNNISQFYLCKNCSSQSIFYTPFCSQCFKCDTMQANLRIRI